MLTIFDGSNGYPISQDDYYIRELASGYDEVIFNVNIRDSIYQYVKEEALVRDRNQNSYLIKQIDAGNETAKVVAQIDLDDWKNELYFDFNNNSATVAQTVAQVLPTGWTIIDQSLVTKRRTIPTSDTTTDYNVTALTVLEDCAKVYDVRFRFDTALKRVYIINPLSYESRGAFATRDLNLRALNYKGKSEGFITRLYAEGKDGLTFASINEGKSYVENKTYANKQICGFWKDDRYTDKQSLLEDATAKLNALARPSQSYDCDILDLANTNPDMYGFEDFSLFEVITLVDDAKGVRTDYQVVERWTYPYYPANNKIILSLSTPNIQSAIQTVFSSLTESTSSFQQIMQSAIANATALITGNSGGYLVLHDSNGDGTPDELLIMNTNDIETATKIWRWNQNGLGYSNNGYAGPYGLAINMDGSIIGDYIAANSIDGGSIRAGTIDAEALSVDAKEELSVLHNYISEDIFTDISVWEYGAVAPYYETIDGKTYVVLDGTAIESYNSNYFVRLPTNNQGDIYFDYSFKFHVDRETIVDAQQRFPFIQYHKLNDATTYTSWWWLNPQTVPANEDFTWNLHTTKTDIDASKTGYVGLYFIPKCKIYLEKISVTSTVDLYTQSAIKFNETGLQALVSSVGIHNYLPYDFLSNAARWKPYSESSYSGGYSVSFRTITVDGVQKKAIAFVGTNLTGDGRYGIITDLIGKCKYNYSFKYQVETTQTFSSDNYIFGLRYVKNGTSVYYSDWNQKIPSGATRTAGQEYSVNYYYNTGDVDYYADDKPPMFWFRCLEGNTLIVYDLEIYADEGSYKSASLSYTVDGLNSVVQSGSIISTINQSAEQITIQANKLDLTGDLSLHGTFTTSQNQQYVGYRAIFEAGRLAFYDGTTLRAKIEPMTETVDGQPHTGLAFTINNESGASLGYSMISGYSAILGNVLANSININNSAVFWRGVTFWGAEDYHVTFNGDTFFNAAAHFQGNVYNSSGGVQFVSDRRKKRNIKDLAISKARSFIMALKPKKYKFIKSISTSDRYHHGFIAQEVKEAMPEDWGVYTEDKEQDFVGLRYDEILADLVKVVQDQQERIEELEKIIRKGEK